MKKTYLLLGTAALLASTAAAASLVTTPQHRAGLTTQERTVINDVTGEKTQTVKYFLDGSELQEPAVQSLKSASRDGGPDGYTVTVKADWDDADYDVDGVVVNPLDEFNPEHPCWTQYVRGLKGGGEKACEDLLPEGDYQVIGKFYKYMYPGVSTNADYMVLVVTKVHIASDTTVTVSPGTACHWVTFNPVYPDGRTFEVPTYDPATNEVIEAGNTDIAYDYHLLDFGRYTSSFTRISNMQFMDPATGVRLTLPQVFGFYTNDILADYGCRINLGSMYGSDAMYLNKAPLITEVLADVTIAGNPNYAYSVECPAFAQTPCMANSAPIKFPYMSTAGLALDNESYDTQAQAPGKTGKLLFSWPDGLNFGASFIFNNQQYQDPSWGQYDNFLNGGVGGINTPEGMVTDKGDFWTYANTFNENQTGWREWEDHPQMTIPSPFDYYTGEFAGELGGSCPIVIFAGNPQINDDQYTYYYSQSFAYNYLGRGNEMLTVDGFFETMNMTLDGKPISLNDDWQYHNTKEGVLKVEWDNPNVRVDGLDGSLKASMTLDCGATDKWPCQLNALQFRNKEGLITDRFATAADGTLAFAGGDFNMNITDNRMEAEVPAELVVEWSPYGKGEWKSFSSVTEDPAKYYMPGIGRYFSTPLTEVDEQAEGGWFDLRITMADASNNTTIQTISPAFRIDDLAGIQSVSADAAAAGESQYFNLQGQRVASDNLQPGIYVRRDADGRAVKAVVK